LHLSQAEKPPFKQKLAGLDLAGNEGMGQPAGLREAFMPVLDRIGHGLNLLDRPELLRRFIDLSGEYGQPGHFPDESFGGVL